MPSQHAPGDYKLEALSDGVWVAFARDGDAPISNSKRVDLGDSALITDTFLTPTAAESLRVTRPDLVL